MNENENENVDSQSSTTAATTTSTSTSSATIPSIISTTQEQLHEIETSSHTQSMISTLPPQPIDLEILTTSEIPSTSSTTTTVSNVVDSISAELDKVEIRLESLYLSLLHF